jgi:hypothetical protein
MINATVDLKELNTCIAMVKSVDDLAIVSIYQNKIDSDILLEKDNGESSFFKINDPNSLVVIIMVAAEKNIILKEKMTNGF